MDDILVGKIARTVKTVSVEDSVGMTAEALRSSGLSELPVVSMGQVVGVISEKAIMDALITGDRQEVSAQPIANLISREVIWVNPYMTTHQAAEVLNLHGRQAVPVMDDYGNYRGMVSRSDIAGALAGTMRPPAIGGLATPLGVHLTCGNYSAGPGSIGLVLSGVSLGAMVYISIWIVFGLAYLVDKTGLLGQWSLKAILSSPFANTLNWMDIVRYVFLGATVPIFFILLRLAPMAGYHAAEHQTVHAIENGEPLKLENVSRMPRVHPRCGTNILAAVGLFILIRLILPEDYAILVAVLVIIFFRQTVGGWIQYYATTRPANEKQLKSGIAAGEELLAKYRSNPSYAVVGWQRIWSTGLVQTMIGWALVTQIVTMFHLLPTSFLGF